MPHDTFDKGMDVPLGSQKGHGLQLCNNTCVEDYNTEGKTGILIVGRLFVHGVCNLFENTA